MIPTVAQYARTASRMSCWSWLTARTASPAALCASYTVWSARISCRQGAHHVEGDIRGDSGSEFFITGQTASEVLRRASEEAWKRVAGGDA